MQKEAAPVTYTGTALHCGPQDAIGVNAVRIEEDSSSQIMNSEMSWQFRQV
jgi:hypothetical protein